MKFSPNLLKYLEAASGFEPENNGFADFYTYIISDSYVKINGFTIDIKIC